MSRTSLLTASGSGWSLRGWSWPKGTISAVPTPGDERPTSLSGGLETVEEVIIDHDVVLVIIDPLVAFLGHSAE